jgi:uncharacterized protein (TIGR02145 family)
MISPKSFIAYAFLTAACFAQATDLKQSTIKDIDGNVYHTTTIGTQVWMVENLKVTRLRDGTPIALCHDDQACDRAKKPSYCWYNSDTSEKSIYGALYNWYAVRTDKLAPKGWHVPSDSEWDVLITSCGDAGSAGYKLKEKGTMHWNDPNRDVSNETGFTALPGGYRFHTGGFNEAGILGYWWSSTDPTAALSGNSYSHRAPPAKRHFSPKTESIDTLKAIGLYMNCKNGSVSHTVSSKNSGFSVRCVKN